MPGSRRNAENTKSKSTTEAYKEPIASQAVWQCRGSATGSRAVYDGPNRTLSLAGDGRVKGRSQVVAEVSSAVAAAGQMML